MPLTELADLDDQQLVSPSVLRAIAHDLFLGTNHPLTMFAP
jgi:hypothetical protein